MARRIVTAVCAAFFFWGCGSDDESVIPPTGLAPPPEGQGVQLVLANEIQSGEESYFCRRFALPSDGALDVARLEHEGQPGIHHVLVYRDPTPATEVTDEVFPCGDIPGQLVYTSQFGSETFDYPDGVGIKFAAGEVLRVEVHHVNIHAATEPAGVKLNLWRTPSAIAQEAGSLFFYHRDLAIPPMSSLKTKVRCLIPTDIEILAGLPHEHRRGSGFRAYAVGDDGERRQFIDSSGYGDLHSVVFDEPVHVSAGEVIEVECDYENDTPNWFYAGPSGPNDEMCLLLGNYYPRMENAAELCTIEDWGAEHTGDKTCGEALACNNNADPSDIHAQPRCFSETCPGSSSEMNRIGNCVFEKCQLCVIGSPDCLPCILENCAAEIEECNAATCE
jgi:hypothetical protein